MIKRKERETDIKSVPENLDKRFSGTLFSPVLPAQDTVLIQKFQKYICNLRIKLCSTVFFQFTDSIGDRERLFVWTSGSHGIKTIGDGKYSCHIRNILTGKTTRISRAIIPFVMTKYCRNYIIHMRQITDHFCGVFNMCLHDLIFFRCQLRGFL